MRLLAQMGGGGAGGGGMGGGGMMMVVMAVLAVLLAVLLIGGVIWLVRSLIRDRGEKISAPEDPLQALDRRFAQGEIDTDEYRERRSALGNRAR